MLGLGVVASVVLSSVPSGAPAPTELGISVTPPSAIVYIDGARRGPASRLHSLRLSPGTHLVRVVNRKDEHQEAVTVFRGKKTHWSWDFEDDRKSEAEAPAPRHDAKAERAAVADLHPQADDDRPTAAALWLKPGSLDTPSADSGESGARRRAAQDLLAAMPRLTAPTPVVARPPAGHKARRHLKSRRHAS